MEKDLMQRSKHFQSHVYFLLEFEQGKHLVQEEEAQAAYLEETLADLKILALESSFPSRWTELIVHIHTLAMS